MPIDRRSLLGLVAATGLVSPFAAARAQDASRDPRMADRALGRDDAKVTVLEYASLTCPHCARFASDVLPVIKTKLIDTGFVKLIYREFPLDQVALTASMVARSLPVERYFPFIETLFKTQDHWAYTRSDPIEALARIAALAGMSRASFDAVQGDTELKNAILAMQAEGEKKYGIDSTPSFVVNGKTYAGEQSFEEFSRLVGAPTT